MVDVEMAIAGLAFVDSAATDHRQGASDEITTSRSDQSVQGRQYRESSSESISTMCISEYTSDPEFEPSSVESSCNMGFSNESDHLLVRKDSLYLGLWEEEVLGVTTATPISTTSMHLEGVLEIGEGNGLEPGVDIGETAYGGYPAHIEMVSNSFSDGLLEFVKELGRGVEATIQFPGFFRNRTQQVILYSEDKGASICWVEHGVDRRPYRLPCSCILEVQDEMGWVMGEEWTEEEKKGGVKVSLVWRTIPCFPKSRMTIEVQNPGNACAFTRGMLLLRRYNIGLA
ncbi:unnamed protein product [Choristocarpus tenellus]